MKKSCLILFAILSVGTVNTFALNLDNGRQVYAKHCIGCHSATGEGMMPGMPNFSRGDGMFKTDREMHDAIRDGTGVMPSFNGILKDEEIVDVIGFLRTLL